MWEQPPLLSAHSFRPAERDRRAAGRKERLGQAQEKKTSEGFWTKHFSAELDRKTKPPKFVRVCGFIHPAS